MTNNPQTLTDARGVHALTHVMEMQNRYQEGISFLRSCTEDWAPDNGFAFHYWWYLALFHIKREDFDGALALFDEQVMPEPDSLVADAGCLRDTHV